jgi:F0F1-type ATP synthase assembly protein I
MDKWLPALKMTGIGFYVGVCIAGGAYLGWWLGHRRPIFLIVGLVAGLIVAIYGVYRMIKPLMNNNNRKEND